MAKVTVKLTGPIFDDARRKKLLDDGIRSGMKTLVARGEATAKMAFTAKGIPAGPFTRSIQGEVRPNRVGVIRATDPRQIRTWLEARTRRGVKLGKGAYGFQAAKRQINALNKQGYFEEHITRRLNG